MRVVMLDASAKAFLDVLRRSHIVPEDRLQPMVAEWERDTARPDWDRDAVAQQVIDSGLVTRWQCEKLLRGKYRGFFLGHYKLLQLLGSGGMSTVYLAEHKLSGHRRAIKVLPRQRAADKSYLERFYREGRAAASLNHPNIVRIYDLASDGELHFMVMEYVEGIDLHKRVKRQGPLTYPLALACVRQAAEGLAQAHSQHIVHRDIKPANLLINSQEVVKILDLGLALMREETESLTLLHNERVMGTADFLAPEQAVDSHNVDPRADIYSLGYTLYFLLTGHPPFATGTIPQRIAAHQSQEPPPLTHDRPDCPAPLVEFVTRMTRKRPEDRFQTCAEVIGAIRQVEESIQSGAAVSRPRSGPPRGPSSEGSVAGTPKPAIVIRRRKTLSRQSYWIATLAVVLMFLLLIALLIYFASR